MAELKNMGKDIDEIKGGMKEIKDDMKPNTEHRITCTALWKAHDKEHASLKTKSWVGDIAAAAAGVMTAVGASMAKS